MRPGLLACALALLAASCGSVESEIESASVIAEVLQSAAVVATTVAAPPSSVPPGCRLVLEEDEYGFEVEVIHCGTPDPSPPDPNWLGSESAGRAADLLHEALVGQVDCGTGVTYRELRTVVADAHPDYSEPLLGAVAALEQGIAHCNKDKDAWATSMTEAILYLEEFLRAVETKADRG